MAYAPQEIYRMGGGNGVEFKEALEQFEQSAAVPVRCMRPGEGRTVEDYTRAWTGRSAEMQHYDGFTEEQRDNEGITILFESYNADVHSNAGLSYAYQLGDGQECYVEWSRDRWCGHWEVYNKRTTEAQVIDAGGVPFVFPESDSDGMVDDESIEPIYGELYDGRVVFIKWAPNQLSQWGLFKWKEYLFDKILENSSEEAREAARQRQAEIAREAFTRMMEDQGNLAVIELREKASEISRERGLLEEQLVNKKADQDQVGMQLTYLLEAQGEVTPEQINSEWEAIERHAMVKSFSCGKEASSRNRRRLNEGREGANELSAGYLKIHTELLWLTHPQTKRKVPLGEYEITLNFGANSARIKNITNAQSEGRIDHPHVESGLLCAADYGTTITELLRKRKLAGMTGMIFNILKILTMADRTAVTRFQMFEEADDKLRRDEGWPAWEAGETEHPMITSQEDDNGTDDDENGDDENA